MLWNTTHHIIIIVVFIIIMIIVIIVIVIIVIPFGTGADRLLPLPAKQRIRDIMIIVTENDNYN